MTDFEIVSDELRDLAGVGRPVDPVNVAMMEGKTVWVPLLGQPAIKLSNRHGQPLLRKGYLLRRRRHDKDGIPGLVMWAVRKEAA